MTQALQKIVQACEQYNSLEIINWQWFNFISEFDEWVEVEKQLSEIVSLQKYSKEDSLFSN